MPEARALQRSRAGLVSRFLADAIDLVVVLAAVGVVYLGASATRFLVTPPRFTWPTPGRVVLGALAWGLLIIYLTVARTSTGRSVGKQVLGLRVVGREDAGLGIGQAFLRAVLCALFRLGLFWSPFTRESSSVQDLIVRTKVIYDWRPRLPQRPAEAPLEVPSRTT